MINEENLNTFLLVYGTIGRENLEIGLWQTFIDRINC